MTTTITLAAPDTRAIDQMLELAVLAQLRIDALDAGESDEPDTNRAIHQVHRDGAILAMLTVKHAGNYPNAQQLHDALDLVQACARDALTDVSDPGYTHTAGGYPAGSWHYEPPRPDYQAAIRAQTEAVETYTVLIDPAPARTDTTAEVLVMPISQRQYDALRWVHAYSPTSCPSCVDETTAAQHWPRWGCLHCPPGSPLLLHDDCDTCRP